MKGLYHVCEPRLHTYINTCMHAYTQVCGWKAYNTYVCLGCIHTCIHIHRCVHGRLISHVCALNTYTHAYINICMHIHRCVGRRLISCMCTIISGCARGMCVYVYVRVCVCACMYVCMYAGRHLPCTCTLLSACARGMCVCMCMYVCVSVCMYVCMWGDT